MSEDSFGGKIKKFKGLMQSAVDAKAQQLADFGADKGRELASAGYPRLAGAAEDAGAGLAALGSTVTSEALDSVPESAADVAMSVGPGRIGKAVRKALPEGLRKRVEEFAKQKGVDPEAAVRQVEAQKGVTQDWVDAGAKEIEKKKAIQALGAKVLRP